MKLQLISNPDTEREKRREYDQISEVQQPIEPISLKDSDLVAQASD